jgi:hypothetical protein
MKLKTFNDFVVEGYLYEADVLRISIDSKNKSGIKEIEKMLAKVSYEKEVSGKNTEFLLPYGDPRELQMMIKDLKDDLPQGATLNEAKKTLKRRYTESYPERKMYSGAKVRAAIFDAVKDGVITEEEIVRILKELGADPQWHKRHKEFFDVSEDGSYCLSQRGKKIYSRVHED